MDVEYLRKQNQQQQSLAQKVAFVKSENALKEFLSEFKLRRDKDVDEIYLPFENISDMNSLERFKNLTRLWLHGNKIRHLPFVQRCYALSELYLQNNLIKSIEFAVRNLTNLKVLFLHANELIDLDKSANELAYLKNLRNLNLFDNPIALEKNYKKLILYKVPSLELFDRNTIKIQDQTKAYNEYERERLVVRETFAFMRNLDSSTSNLLSSSSSNSSSSSSSPQSSSRSFKNSPKSISTNNLLSLASKANTTSNDQPSTNHDQNNKNLNYLRRSIKEYSYFDWSKVKLYDTNNNIDTINNETYSNASEGGGSLLLPNTNKTTTYNDDYQPQVITIRFT